MKEELTACETLRRLFELYDKDWSLDFDFSKLSESVPSMSFSVIHRLHLLVKDEEIPDSFMFADADNEKYRLWSYIDTVKDAIVKSGRASMMIDSYWVDLRPCETVGILKINQYGVFVVGYPNQNTWGCRDISLPNMIPAKASEAAAMYEKANVDKWRQIIQDYDSRGK